MGELLRVEHLPPSNAARSTSRFPNSQCAERRTSSPRSVGMSPTLGAINQNGIVARGGDHAFQGGRPASTLERRPRAQLTPRELEVLELLARGLQNKQICRELHIAGGTVKAHVTRILEKLEVATRLQAVIVAIQRNLLRSHEVARAARQSGDRLNIA